jgi:myo-inositol-1(or 4)-monophosphatase
MDELVEHVHRVRAMGTIAVSLCQVALTRVDGMATLWKTRSVDAAAAQLIVRESGGVVAFPGCDTPLASPLVLDPNGPIVAARNQRDLDRLAEVVAE